MVDFTKQPAAIGFFTPQRFEADVYDCEVIGKIPTDMNGAFVRLGGDWCYPSNFNDDSPFNEDGYVSMFRFRNGRVDYKGRWVRTERFQKNSAAQRQLYGYYRNPFTDDPSVRDPEHPNRRTVSNTTPLAFAGKLFTLKEDGLPYELNPKTLETIGTHDFHGKWKSQTFTAHTKIDPVSGEMIAFGYEATGLASDDVFVYTIDKQGHVTREARFKVPYVSMIHDIALTEKHIIFPVFGYVTSLERLHAGKVHWAWDSSKPAYIGILARDSDGKDIRWFKGPERCMVHTCNARTEGNKVILEAPVADSNQFPFFPAVDGSPWNPLKGRHFIRRHTFDLASKGDSFTEEILFPERSIVDLIRIDQRYLSLPYRYAYAGYNDTERPFDEARAGNLHGRVTNCYGRFDLRGDKTNAYFAGNTHSLQEPYFVPRTKHGPEGEGYLIGVASNYAEMRSELIIADAQNLEAGDIARVILPFRSLAQVHGIWVTEDQLPLG
ncbi:MAG: putative dioxygenase [Gammaproteobacteria bacterium]|nr:putative dioxygenase [Gammaproteobacteria bacterium]